jgi:hypothetical protein
VAIRDCAGYATTTFGMRELTPFGVRDDAAFSTVRRCGEHAGSRWFAER